jgi:sec-independent protein translocase protein TatA
MGRDARQYKFGVYVMGGLSLWHWVIVLVVVLLLFGRGRISDVMGDFGKGIKSFKAGLGEAVDDKSAPAAPQAPAAQITSPEAAAAPAAAEAPTNANPQ